MNTLWSAEQREWLQAMGHQVWMLAGARGDATAPATAAEIAAAPPAPPPREPPRPRETPAGDRLLQALRRAAAGGDEDTLIALLPDPATLRGNAAAKRALWPRLRALRKGGRA